MFPDGIEIEAKENDQLKFSYEMTTAWGHLQLESTRDYIIHTSALVVNVFTCVVVNVFTCVVAWK